MTLLEICTNTSIVKMGSNSDANGWLHAFLCKNEVPVNFSFLRKIR
jgi:hypothetical protein